MESLTNLKFVHFQDYSALDFSTPPVPMLPQHMQIGGSGTLRRGMANQRGMVPPPDVTQMTKPLHANNIHDTSMSSMTASPNSMLMGSTLVNNISHVVPHPTHQQLTPKQPQGILKDPNRPKQPLQANNLQILNVQTGPPPTMLGNNLLMAAGYPDPSSANLSSFNASLGYTDADGHLV